MSLQVWLPLTGDLHNQGLSDLIVTNNGATVDNNGKIGKCYYFNGNGQYLQLSKSLTNLYTGDFSWAIWLKPTDATRGIIFSEYSSSGASNVAFELLANRVIRVYWAASPDWSTGVSLTQDVWSHVAITRSGNTIKVYVNGELKASKSDTTLANHTSSSFIRLGDDYRGGTSVSYMGYMNDARIYDHALSDKEVEEIAKGLVLHYKLDNDGLGNKNILPISMDLTKWPKESGVSVEWDSNKNMYKIITTGKTSSRWGIYQNITLTANTTYTFSVDGMKVDQACAFGFAEGNAWPSNAGSFTTDRQRLSKTITVGSADAICRIYLNVTCINGGTNNAYFALPKLEVGDVATDWSPAAVDGLTTDNIVYDSSGYNNNGDTTNANITYDSKRYSIATILNGTTVDNSSNTKVGAAYLRGFLSLTSPSALTISWWGKNDAYGRGGIFQTSVNADPSECTDYNTTAIANWDTTFRVYNGSTAVNFFSSFIKDGTWHYHTIIYDGTQVKYYCDGIQKVNSALTGVLPSFNGFCMGLGKAGGVYRQIKQSISDFRIYATALTAEQILDLYHTSASIDKEGNVYAREIIE